MRFYGFLNHKEEFEGNCIGCTGMMQHYSERHSFESNVMEPILHHLIYLLAEELPHFGDLKTCKKFLHPAHEGSCCTLLVRSGKMRAQPQCVTSRSLSFNPARKVSSYSPP